MAAAGGTDGGGGGGGQGAGIANPKPAGAAGSYGGGAVATGSGGPVGITSTILSDSAASGVGTHADCRGTITAGDSNIVEGATGCTRPVSDTRTGDPGLAAAGLASNGGPTQTIALANDSQGIDNGGNPGALSFDQRGTGFPRVIGPSADVGAFEADVVAVTVTKVLVPSADAGRFDLKVDSTIVKASAGDGDSGTSWAVDDLAFLGAAGHPGAGAGRGPGRRRSRSATRPSTRWTCARWRAAARRAASSCPTASSPTAAWRSPPWIACTDATEVVFHHVGDPQQHLAPDAARRSRHDLHASRSHPHRQLPPGRSRAHCDSGAKQRRPLHSSSPSGSGPGRRARRKQARRRAAARRRAEGRRQGPRRRGQGPRHQGQAGHRGPGGRATPATAR